MVNVIVISILTLTVLMPGVLSPMPQPFPQQEQIASGQLKQGSATNESFLEKLVKTDNLAYTVWNLTRKYDISLSVEKCKTELEKEPIIISFHIVNISLEETNKHLYNYGIYLYYKGYSLKEGNHMYQNRSSMVVEQELYLTTVKSIIQTGREDKENYDLVCASNSVFDCGCISKNSLREFEGTLNNFKNSNTNFWEFLIFGTYIDPIFRIMIMIIGLIMNGVLLFVFINEKSVRIESNIMIFSLIVNNVFMLIFYLPANYITMYHLEFAEKPGYTSVQMFVVSANVVIILLINIQRYFDVSRVLNTNNQNSRLTPIHRCIIYTTVTWGYSAGVAILLLFVRPHKVSSLKTSIFFLLYLFIFSVVMAIFNSMTARKLQRSAEQGQNSTEFRNVTGSAIILHLTIVYYITHLLYFIYSLFEEPLSTDSGIGYNSTTSIRIVIFILHIIFFSYPCLNVLALYKCSGTYRSFLKVYLFRCWYNPQEGQYVTMNSGENSDAQRLCTVDIS